MKTHSVGLQPDLVAALAATHPTAPALLAEGLTLGYADLDAAVTGTARRLAALGIEPGDRVATLLRNGLLPALLPHAVLRLGATLVPMNVRLSPAELSWQLGDAAPRLLIAEQRTRSLAHEAAEPHAHLRVIETVDGELHGESADVALRLEHPLDDVLAVIYTSGTTGTPKGAMLTLGNFIANALASHRNLEVRAGDRWLLCLPMFHVGGLSILFRCALVNPAAAVVHTGFDAGAVNDAIDQQGITMISVVTVMLQRMLDARDDRPYPPTLRCVLLGGGPAPLPLLERCARLGIPVLQTYGLTETGSQVATLAPEDALRRIGSAGKALPGNSIRIDVEGRDAAPGEQGEIVVQGPVVTKGYLNRPDATGRTIVDGWLHTGDIGYLDDEGYLYVLDRRDDLIITGGENVYPAEVEAALHGVAQVAEACVVGLPDPQWGQRVVAVVRLAEDSRIEATAAGEMLRVHCQQRLAGYKVPREIVIWNDSLPRTASGKLRRAVVRETLSGRAARGSAP